jgi:hypothetical protein
MVHEDAVFEAMLILRDARVEGLWLWRREYVRINVHERK